MRTFTALSADFIQRHERDLYHCSSCNYCVDAVWPERGMTAVCATLESHSRAPGYSGRGFIEAARAAYEGLTLDADALAARVFTCTTCGNCERACPIGLAPASVGRALRAELVAQDALPAPLAALRERMAREGNPDGRPRAERHAWCGEDVTPRAAGRYFVGCAAAYGRPEEARAGLALLLALGAEPDVAQAGCCGAPLAEIGCGREADALARAARAALVEDGCVVLGAECRRQLDLPAGAGLARQVVDAWRAGRLRLRARSTAPREVHLVESCQLRGAKRGEATDEQAAAELFAALGVTLMNSDFPNHHATCCGAAGGMPEMAPASARAMAAARLPARGVVVSLDTRCANHLRGAASDALPVLGFAEFLTTHFDIDGEGAP